MRVISIKVALLGLAAYGCATVPDNPRNSLVNVNSPFGLSWSLTSEEKSRYLEVEDPAECAELFEHLEGAELESSLQNCLQDNRIKLLELLPPPLEYGFLEVVYTPDGTVISRSHVFGFSSSLAEMSKVQAEKQADTIDFEIEQWITSLEFIHGEASSHGRFSFSRFENMANPNAPCAVWIVEPVGIFLCRSRLFTVDSSISSLQFVRLDRASSGLVLKNEIIGK